MKRMALFVIVTMLLLPVFAWAGCPSPDDLSQGTGKVYEHIHCDGWYMALSTGTNEPDLRHFGGPSSGQNINDMISSIVLGPGIKCEFYKDIKFKGKIGPLIKGTYDDVVKAGYNDKISSIKCYVP